MHKWTQPLPRAPKITPARPALMPVPSPRRTLLNIHDEAFAMARDLERCLQAHATDANEVELEPVGKLLIWIEAIAAEAGRVAAALERRTV